VAQLTRAQIRAQVAAMCGVNNDSGSDSRTYLDQDINTAGKRVWVARPWRERVVETILFTVAPYTAGTVDLTQGSTSVTGSGTTWTTAFTGRKLALAIGRPWYRFTRTGDTTGTIPTGGYAEATVTASPYGIFQDEIDLTTTMDVINEASVLSEARRGGMMETTESDLDQRWYVHGATGIPAMFAPVMETTAGTKRIRVWPIPDTVYRIRVRGLASFTDMTSDSDLCVLGPDKERALILAAALEVQRRGDSRPVTSDAEVEKAIAEQWEAEAPQQPLSVTRRPMGGSRRFTMYLRDPS